MSYDIRFAVKVVGADSVYAVIGRPEHDSPTYNLREMFVSCMDWDYHQGEWYPMDQVFPKIERGIHELKFHQSKYLKYEPDNGWGTIGSALEALQSIYKWFDPGDWECGWDQEIPLECIYMRW